MIRKKGITKTRRMMQQFSFQIKRTRFVHHGQL
uniref:Uncharacterized protein n=1 Tax=Rhizophora mucronata TaxID=61149 RepID=A0A2P2L2L4_RHIMU